MAMGECSTMSMVTQRSLERYAHMGALSIKAMTTEMPSLHLLYDISAPNILHLCTNLHACVIYCVWGANMYM